MREIMAWTQNKLDLTKHLVFHPPEKQKKLSLHTLGCPRSDSSRANCSGVGVEQRRKGSERQRAQENETVKVRQSGFEKRGAGGLGEAEGGCNLGFKASIGIKGGLLLDWSSEHFLLRGTD